MQRVSFPLLILLGMATQVWSEDKPKTGVRVERDIAYSKAGTQELQLDLAMPDKGDGPFPAIICLHGGGWRAGKRQDLSTGNPKSSLIEVAAARGFVAATVSYRLSDKAKWPAQIEDCKAAVRWLRAHAKTYKIDPEKIGAIGFSAGGHLVCMLGATDKKDGFDNGGGNADQSSRVQAVVSFFGPANFTKNDWSKNVEEGILIPFLGAKFSEKPELYKNVSPLFYVKKGAPPFLFFHGDKDTLVSPYHSREMAEKLKAVGSSARVVVMEGEAHGWATAKMRKTLEQSLDFFEETLKK